MPSILQSWLVNPETAEQLDRRLGASEEEFAENQ